MYAHQVVEDIKNFLNPALESEIVREGFGDRKNNPVIVYKDNRINHNIVGDIISKIKGSVCFHFGEINDVISLFANSDKEIPYQLFKNNMCRFIKFPFDSVWFDYDSNGYKLGICAKVLDKTNVFYVQYFMKHPGKLWGLSPQGYLGVIGEDFSDDENSERIARKIIVNYDEIKKIGKIRNLIPIRNSSESFINCLNKEEKDFLIDQDNGVLFVLQSSLILLNTKNISTAKNYPPEALNKKRIKQGKQPLFTYRTLIVNPMSEKKRSDGPHEPTGIKQRLHFCRGHFKEYTEQNKLFGKHTGLYWWQPMVRGNKELGLVHKDYEVRAA